MSYEELYDLLADSGDDDFDLFDALFDNDEDFDGEFDAGFDNDEEFDDDFDDSDEDFDIPREFDFLFLPEEDDETDNDEDFVEDIGDEDCDTDETDEDDEEEDEEDEEGGGKGLGHRNRLRRRVSRDGLEEYTPEQLLEMLLCYVLPRQDVKGMCDALLDHYGNLRGVFLSNFEEYRQFPGMSEAGAEWLDKVAGLVRAFSRLRVQDGPRVANPRQLRIFARHFLKKYGAPCCLQLITDGEDYLIFYRVLCRDLQWGKTRCIARAVEDAGRMHAANAYLIVLTDSPADHPTEYDMKSLRDYALLMHHAQCEIKDVLFLNRRQHVSLHRSGQIPDMTPYILRPVAEDEKEVPLVLDHLIVRSYPGNDPFHSI